MRRTLLILVLLITALPLLWLIYACFSPTDANLGLPHSTAHLHADAQSLEVIYTSASKEEAPDDFERDLAVLTIKRSSFGFGWSGSAVYTSYVLTSPQLAVMPLTALLPTILFLRMRRAMYRRLEEPMAPVASQDA